MSRIHLKTQIKAPIEQVFNLSRSIDFHIKSSEKTKESAIAGRTNGYIELGETVTWRGKHFGIYWTHQSLITSFQYPTYFTDEMIKGYFKNFKHQHSFLKTNIGTEMIDIIEYEIPYNMLGKILDQLLLKKYLIQFITTRNHTIKHV